MNLQPAQYFALIVPASVVLLGLSLVIAGGLLRNRQVLSWLGLGYILPSLALGWQSLMDNAQLARWSVVAAALYLGGAWSLAHGLALRHGGRIQLWPVLGIGLPTLALLGYYSLVVDQLWVRAFWLNLALGSLLLLPMRQLWRRPVHDDWLERSMRLLYGLCAAAAFLRAVLIAGVIPAEHLQTLTRSGYWLMLLSWTLLFSIGFMLVLLACSIRDVLRTLRDERNRDPLTLLFNRRGFFEAAEQVLQCREGGSWALLACDVDHFKAVNDRLGHDAGDRVLQGVAQVLLANTCGQGRVARFGGEEFVILLPCRDLPDASAMAERIRRQLSQAPLADGSHAVTASFGLARIQAGEALSEALARADRALYQAKGQGRNQVCLAAD